MFSNRSIFEDRRLICHRARSHASPLSHTWGRSSATQFSAAGRCEFGDLDRARQQLLQEENCFTSLMFLPANYIESNDLQFGDHLPRAPGDLGLAVVNYEMKTAESGCYTTSLHKAGLQKISALWSGDDLHPVTDAESGSFTVSLLFLFRTFGGLFFFCEARGRSQEGCGVKKKKCKV